MRVLFVAPEICTPYTEGRKRFVLDLIDNMRNHNEVFLITTTKLNQKTTVPVPHKTAVLGYGLLHLFFLIFKLKDCIRLFKPDLVCVFPYGTFRNSYYYASTVFMSTIDKICSSYGVPCLTIMYSIEDTIPEQLSKHVSNLAISQRADWPGIFVNVGLKHRHWYEFERKSNGRELLFMAGMWQMNTRRVEHIIQTRGLAQLLQAGKLLSDNTVRLTIAAPLFASVDCKEYLLSHPLNTWPEQNLTILSEVSVPQIYSKADLFVFPYLKEITQFIPSSVIESMLANTCVAMSDLEFLRPLANKGKTAYLFPINDPNAMAKILLNALNNSQLRLQKAQNAKTYAQSNWSIDVSTNQINEFYNRYYSSNSLLSNRN